MDVSKSKLLAVAVFLAACGGTKTNGTTPDGGTSEPTGGGTTEPAPEPAGPVTWDDSWGHDEKAEFMEAQVLPQMKTAFKAHSEERWGGFNCKTCHGDPWKGQPKDALPKLTLKGGEFDVPEDEKPIVEFMKTEVVPKMAAMFGQEPFDPATGKGFGCGGCHVVEVAE